MTEHEEEYLRERRAEADAGARERKAAEIAEARELLTRLPRIGFGGRICQALEIAVSEFESGNEEGLDPQTLAYWLGKARMRVGRREAPGNPPSLLEACALAHAALDAATSTLAGLDLSPRSRLDELCGELAAAREACGVALGRVEGEE
jgi:hypothetical protein